MRVKRLFLWAFVLGLVIAAGSAFAANVLVNPGFEDGTTGWSASLRSTCTIATTTPGRDGTGNLLSLTPTATDPAAWISVAEGSDVTGSGASVAVSGAKFYKLSAWVKVPSAATTPVPMALRFRFNPSGSRWDVGTQTVSTADWVQLVGPWLQPSATDTILGYFEVHSNSNAAYYLDDCSLEQVDPILLSGRVVNGSGAGVDGASIYISSPDWSAPVTTTSGGGYYSIGVPPGAYSIGASYPGLKGNTSATVVSTPVTASDIVMVVDPDYDADLIFSAYSSTVGTTGPWPCACPAGASLSRLAGSPGIETIGGVQWEKNNASTFDAFLFAKYTTAIPCAGASIVAVARPVRGINGNPWTSIVDVFYDRFCMGIRNDTGAVCVKRNYNTNNTTDYGPEIPENQTTILSFVAQIDGSYKVYANGTQIMSAASPGGTFASLNPNHMDTFGSDPDFTHYINVGRNQPDAWPTFNGYIGDVYLYKVALSDNKRTLLEWQLEDKFGVPGTTITISGQVLDANNGNAPVPGATVVVQVGGVDVATLAAPTDSSGHYTAQARVKVGDSITVHASKLNFQSGDSTPPISFDGSQTTFTGINVLVASITTVNISGTVNDFITGNPVVGLKLIANVPDMPASYPVTTGAGGTYSVAVASGYNTYIMQMDPTNSPLPVMLTVLADRTISAAYGLFTDVTGKNLLVSYPSTITGKVVTSDSSSAAGFAIVAAPTTPLPEGVAVPPLNATTASGGTYSISVLPGYHYTVTAKKGGYVTMPGPQTVNVSAGNTNYPLGDFTATPTTINGVLTDAATGQPIYNGVVQSGTGQMSSAAVTDNTGAFTLPAIGCGGVEIFGDALGYHCKNYFVTGTGTTGAVTKNVALNAETETGVVVNGSFENLASGQPTDWTEKWATGGMTFASSSDVPDAFSGSHSVWYTGTASYDALAQYVQLQPNSLYTFYFKAKADAEVAQWFPMVSFRGDYTDPDTSEVSTDQERKGWISGETGYDGWVHTPPYTWMQYLKFHTYSGDEIQPFVRITPPASSSTWAINNIAATFCYGDLPPVGKGCYIDDVVIDRVAADEPLVTVGADQSWKPVGANNRSALTDANLPGKLVKVWGKISSSDAVSFVISDGYSPSVTVKINGVTLPTGFAVDKTAVVTGVLNADKTIQAQSIQAF